MAKNSKKAFVDAVKARGGVRYFDLGGGVTLAPTTTGGSVGGNTTSGGITSLFTPQSNYQAQLAPTTQLNYTPLVNAAANQALTGQAQYNQNLQAEQGLQQQLQQNALGQGPNPAQAALNQATGQNIANQAALMAGTRGASQNAGLIAQEAARQGAATQQQAVGQGATMQAQQQLAAQSALAGLQGQIGSQITGQQQANTNLFGTGAGAANAQNANLVNNYAQAQGTNAQTAAANAGANQKTAGGLLGGIGSLLGLAEGGEVPRMAEGGDMLSGARSSVGKFLTGMSDSMSGNSQNPYAQFGAGVNSAVKGMFASPSSTPAPALGGSSAGSSDLPQAAGAAMLAAKGGMAKQPVTAEKLAAKGMEVPGKAKVKGDSLKNDHVPAVLSPGEIVLPRSVTQAPDAAQRAAAFVQAIQAKQGLKRGKRG